MQPGISPRRPALLEDILINSPPPLSKLFALSALSLLFGCPQVAAPARCETLDAGVAEDEVHVRVVNLGREAVTVKFADEETGHTVQPLGALMKTGHVTLNRRTATIDARNFDADGTPSPVSLPFEFENDDTVVVRDLTPSSAALKLGVGKQTQGATFGEKVRAGLAGVELDDGVDFEGDCVADHGATGAFARVRLRGEPDDADCDGTTDDFVRPSAVEADGSPYFIRGAGGELQVAWVSPSKQGIMPGAGIVSAAVSSMYVLNATGSRAPASVSVNGITVATNVAPGQLVRVKPSAIISAGRRNLDASGRQQKASVKMEIGSAVQTLELSALDTGPCKPPYLCDFLSGEATLLVVSQDTASSATVLRHARSLAAAPQVVFASTLPMEAEACVAAFPGDDTCVMGSAKVSSVSALAGGPGGAAAASYARAGQVLSPPRSPPLQGTGMRFTVTELGVVGNTHAWDSPQGLTPVATGALDGFAIAAPGTALDPQATDRRALFYVDTRTLPWSVVGTLSK